MGQQEGRRCSMHRIEAGLTGRNMVKEMARLGFTIGHELDRI